MYVKQGDYMVIVGPVSGKDARYKEFESGATVADFSVRYDKDPGGESGAKQGKYIDVKCWRELSQYARYLERGDVVLVAGKLTRDKRKDDDGNDVKGVLQDSGASVTTYNNANLAAEALKSGKIKAVVVDKLPAELIAKNSDGKLKAVELVYEDGSNTAESYAVCVAKGNDTLLEVVNKVIKDLLDSGKIDEFIVTHTTNALA